MNTRTDFLSLFSGIRRNGVSAKTAAEAVDLALGSMPDDFMIKEFLIKNKAEVKSMCITEYDEQKVFAALRKEEREYGREESRTSVALKLLRRGKDSFDEIAEITGLTIETIKELADGNVPIAAGIAE